jgi:hypothetical protein
MCSFVAALHEIGRLLLGWHVDVTSSVVEGSREEMSPSEKRRG